MLGLERAKRSFTSISSTSEVNPTKVNCWKIKGDDAIMNGDCTMKNETGSKNGYF